MKVIRRKPLLVDSLQYQEGSDLHSWFKNKTRPKILFFNEETRQWFINDQILRKNDWLVHFWSPELEKDIYLVHTDEEYKAFYYAESNIEEENGEVTLKISKEYIF